MIYVCTGITRRIRGPCISALADANDIISIANHSASADNNVTLEITLRDKLDERAANQILNRVSSTDARRATMT